MKLTHALLYATLAGLAGCPSTPSAITEANKQLEMQGSPFRYVALSDSSMTLSLLPLPAGPSKAVQPLAQQALDSITQSETRQGRATTSLEEVRHLQDGREVWILRTLGDSGIAYVVSFEAPSRAGSNVRMKGPYTYKK